MKTMAHEKRCRIKNQWLEELLGPDYTIAFVVHDYDLQLACRLMAKDERRWYIGTAFRYGLDELPACDYYQDAIDDAVKNAFEAIAKTFPRMDRIMRYGK